VHIASLVAQFLRSRYRPTRVPSSGCCWRWQCLANWLRPELARIAQGFGYAAITGICCCREALGSERRRQAGPCCAALLAAAGGRRADHHTARIGVRAAVIAQSLAEQLASAGDKTSAVPKMTAPATVAIGAGASACNCDAWDLLLAVRFINIFGRQIVPPRCPDRRGLRPLVRGGHYRCRSVKRLLRRLGEGAWPRCGDDGCLRTAFDPHR
jgi:hypothetical protein